jgi:hypothetical protein
MTDDIYHSLQVASIMAFWLIVLVCLGLLLKWVFKITEK